ncbi:MAG: metallophosphoesterase [Cyanobacteria bacterium SBC]|nr:metallophosphoesterase [Cyanobacteria bacterium SBC]
MKRRQLFVLGGSFLGLGLGVAVHKALTQPGKSNSNTPSNTPVSNTPTSTSSPPPAPTPPPSSVDAVGQAIAPEGLFAPVRGDVRIAVISDLNGIYGSTTYEPQVDRAVELIPDWEPDLVLCSGDMVAGQDPFLTESEIRAMWEAFDRHIAIPIRSANLPYGFTIGNHDASGVIANGAYLYKSERDLAGEYWSDPKHNPGLNFIDRTGFPFYYSFLQNDIFYLVWDASCSRIPPEQIAWAEKSLASDVAKQAKLRIAVGHLPLYAVAVGRDELGEVLADADDLRSMLERHGVHTYISGHHHAYFPGRRGELELLHTGALGSGPRVLLDSTLLPTHTISIVDVDLSEGTTQYTTYNAKTLEVIDLETLPRIIVGPNGWVLRRDVTWEELNVEEQTREYIPLD